MSEEEWEEVRIRWKEEAIRTIANYFIECQEFGCSPESLVAEARLHVEQVIQATEELERMEPDREREQ